MIYVCIPCRDEARTVGLLLWRIRQVFTEFPREYQLFVADDASTDGTAEVLQPYARVLPLTVVSHRERVGYAASVTELLRLAVERTDRPRRDCAILMHADFAHDARALPDLVRGIESGADLVVAEGRMPEGAPAAERLVRRLAPVLLGSRARVPGVRDPISGFAAMRCASLKGALQGGAPFLSAEGRAANAELLARVAPHARRIERVSALERTDRRDRPRRATPWELARSLWRARRTLGAGGGAPPSLAAS